MATIKTSDEVAEETLVGLMLTGDAVVYRFLDVDAADFENVTYRAIAAALLGFGSVTADIALSELIGVLDDYGMVGEGRFGLPLSWYCELLARAVDRTNKAMDKDPMSLAEAVTCLSLRVKVAAANRHDEITGAAIVSEILALPDSDRLTLGQVSPDPMTPAMVVERLMEAQGPGAEYLGRFKEGARSWVVSVLLEKAEERVLVEA